MSTLLPPAGSRDPGRGTSPTTVSAPGGSDPGTSDPEAPGPGVTPDPGDPDRADGAGPVDPGHRIYQPMSIRGPALVVLGLAVLILVAGAVASALASGTSTTRTLRQITIPDGTTVPLAPATKALSSIVSAGEPPADILGNVAVPSRSTVVRSLDADHGAGQYDRTVVLQTGLSADQVADLYRTLLPRLGWKNIDNGSPASGEPGTVVLFRKGSGDSFYWELGATVSPTTSAGTTRFSLELFELPDAN